MSSSRAGWFSSSATENDAVDLERVICPLHELPDPGAKAFTMGGGDWPLRGFVVRRGQHVHAYVNHCPHAGFPLNCRPDAFLASQAPLGLRRLPVRVERGYVILDDGVPLEEPPDLGR